MKDAYSFDVDPAGLVRTYQAMYEAYQRIFSRCGLTVLACEADSGVMGGAVSHEFMAPSASGEDRVVRCAACGYAANLEAATCAPSVSRASSSTESPKPLEEVPTPGQHTVEQVSRFLKVPPVKLIKTLLYDVGDDHVAVLVRGDHEVNEAKLARLVQSPRLKLSNPQTIERLSGGPVGFTGPVALRGVRLLADAAVTHLVNAVTGANRPDAHLMNVNPGREFHPDVVADIRLVTPEDPCPTCGKTVEFLQAIEVGHVFQLGTKYSQALGATVQTAAGQLQPMIMGCYGIGVNRILAAAIEQRHDGQGLIWPASISPFHVVVTVLEADNPSHRQLGEELTGELEQAGREVLLDDRVQSPGAKLKDADLIGIPVQVVIGRVWEQEHRLEVVERASKAKQSVERARLLAAVTTLLAPTPTATL